MDYLDQMKDHLIMTQKWLVLGGGIFLLTLFGAIIYNYQSLFTPTNFVVNIGTK